MKLTAAAVMIYLAGPILYVVAWLYAAHHDSQHEFMAILFLLSAIFVTLSSIGMLILERWDHQ